MVLLFGYPYVVSCECRHMNDSIKDFREKCSNLLSLTESGDFKSVDINDIGEFIMNPYVMNKMGLSGWYLMHIPPNLLKKPIEHHTLDSYYGTISFYDWHKIPEKSGGEFSPINYLLQKIEKMFPDEKNILDTIYRKTAYLNILEKEIKYLSTRYIWTEKSEFKEIFLAKFENFTTSLVELIITCINLYERTYLGISEEKVDNFSDVLSFLTDPNNKLPAHNHWGINDSINLSFYIYIRNSLVHNFSKIEYLDNEQNPTLKIDNIPYKKRYGLFKAYIENEFKEYKGRKTPNSFHQYHDERFPYLSFEFYLTKKSTLDLEKSKIGFEMNIIDLTHKMLGNLFLLQKDLFTTISIPSSSP